MRRLFVAVIVLAVTAGGCGSTSRPDVAQLEAEKNVDGLVEASRDYDTALAATSALGRLKDRRAVAPLTRLLGDPEVYQWQVRPLLHALAQIGDPRSVSTLLGSGQDAAFLTKQFLLMGKPAAPKLAAFLDGTLRVRAEGTVAMSRSKPQAARRSAASTLGTVGTRRARADVTAVLVSRLRAEIRRSRDASTYEEEFAAESAYKAESEFLALVNRRDPSKLFPLLHRADTYQVYWGLMRLGKGGTESELARAFRLLGSPDTFPTIPWATDYLNSGNTKLEAAAREWMSAHGYTEVPSPIGGGGGWGTLK